MEELAAQIVANVTTLTTYLRENNLPQPSLARDCPPTFPVPSSEKAIHLARLNLIEACKSLCDVALGPVDMLNWSALLNKYECASLRAITGFNMAAAVPLDGEASFQQIATKTGLSEDFVRRIIRYATTSRIFNEHRPGYVVHTAASAILATDASQRANIDQNMEVAYPASAKINEAANAVASGEPNQTAFNLAFGTDKTWFEYMREDDQQSGSRFNESMKYWTSNATYSADHIVDGCDWGSITDGLVVDVGGGHGQVSILLARKFDNLRFIVQDQAGVIKEAEKDLPPDVNDRITFMPYNFFDEQQPVAADVYLLRWILHDWSTKYCQKILRNIIATMKPGSRIVIMEQVLAPPNTLPKMQEKLQRTVDLQMMTMLNGQERDENDWRELFRGTDERLNIVRITKPPGSTLSVMEVSIA